MGARGRMAASKAAVIGLLQDAYVKRDRVAVITFSGNNARVIVPATSSIERAQRLLTTMAVGGQTPLASGSHALEDSSRQSCDGILPFAPSPSW